MRWIVRGWRRSAAVRSAFPTKRPVCVRVSATDWAEGNG